MDADGKDRGAGDKSGIMYEIVSYYSKYSIKIIP